MKIERNIDIIKRLFYENNREIEYTINEEESLSKYL